MTYSALPTAEFGRRQLRDILSSGLPRSATLQAVIAGVVAQWGLVAFSAATFGVLNNPSATNQAKITSATAILTSGEGAVFAASDVGRTVHIQGAGVAGATMVSIIDSFQSALQVTLRNKAQTTVDGSTTTGTAGLAVWGDVPTVQLGQRPALNINAAGVTEGTGAASAVPVASTLPAAVALGNTGTRFQQAVWNSNLDGQAVYAPIFGSVDNVFDGLQVVTDVPVGSTISGSSGIASYMVANESKNCVAFFACSRTNKNNVGLWGLNVLLQDNPTRAVGALTGVVLINEIDFNVMCPGTSVLGFSVGGNCLAQPQSAIGYMVNTLGPGMKWDVGFQTFDGVVRSTGFSYAISIGADATTGTNIPSQRQAFFWFDGAGTRNIAVQQVTGNAWVYSTSGVWSGVQVLAGDFIVDTAHGLTVNGNRVISDRIGGYGTPTGGSRISAFPGATATLLQTSQALAQLMLDLKTHGMIGT